MSMSHPTCEICKKRPSTEIRVYLPGFRKFCHYAEVCTECWDVSKVFTDKWDQHKAKYDQKRRELEEESQESRLSILGAWRDAAR